MSGNDQVRRCGQCNLNVYNFAELSTEEARVLLRNAASGRICARLFRRFDGTVLTRDCPIGLTETWRKVRARLVPMGVVSGLVLTLLLSISALLGDNIRRLFAMSGQLAGPDVRRADPHPPIGRPLPLKRFEAQ